jgi:5S rRNA maturation endonuclease (ribonuclease M5)
MIPRNVVDTPTPNIASSEAVQRVLDRLPDAKRNGVGWMARCPAHDDRKASLSITEGGEGRAVLNCHALCDPEAVVTALGLQWRDLFVGGITETSKRGRITHTYRYVDEHGALLYEAVRYHPKDFRQRRPHGSGWVWSMAGIRRVLYRLPELITANAERTVFILEGEKDVDRARDAYGLLATCNTGGAGKWRDEYNETLHGRHVAIIPDNDEAGENHAQQIAQSLHGIAASVKIVHLPNLPAKGDLSDWHGDGDELDTLVERTPVYGSAPAEEAAASEPLFNPERARVTISRLDAPVEPPRFIVKGMFSPTVGVEIAPGGTGKTSLNVSEGVHIILGRDLYGHEVLRPGGILYVTQEDGADKLIYILDCITRDLNLSRGERERVADSFFIEDLENRRTRFVEADERGNLSPTGVADQLIDAYAGKGISIVNIDPLIFFSAGERWMNDGGAELMLEGRRISRALDCTVQFVHHCSIQTSRDKPDDQYAGRSAAAIADNARFVRVLWPYAHTDGDKFGTPAPTSISAEDIAQRRLLVLKIPKLSDAPPATDPIWIHRVGWRFEHVENEHRSREDAEREMAAQICDFVASEEQRDVWYTANTLEAAHADVGIPRNQLRKLLPLCEQKGWLIHQIIPEGHPFRHAKRKDRLTVGCKP